MPEFKTATLPKKYHQAVCKWRDTYIQDYDLLLQNWERFWPKQPKFDLCSFCDGSVCPNVEVGQFAGQPKFTSASEMGKEQADHLLKAVKAQASTELGSIQQHRLTLARAESEKDQFRILRMMAEELRHAYQMFHVLLDDDWSAVTDVKGEDMVEEVLNMRTGSHVLGAFNIDFDTFLDNAMFCCVIDRVGKYQLDMQKVSAYRPMSESMPPMLLEEAFHLSAGVTPLRRWAKEAAVGKGTMSMKMLQEAIDKWIPRGLDMFGDERGGGRNVQFGFKPMKNGEAMGKYYEEMKNIIRDLNVRHLRARHTELSREDAERILAHGDSYEGTHAEELLRLPSAKFFRRRGPHAFLTYDREGQETKDFAAFKAHLLEILPDAYVQNRDFLDYLNKVDQVANGELEQPAAVRSMPQLSRVGGACMCANAVRWVNGSPLRAPLN